MSVLYIRGSDGAFVPIRTIKGEPGIVTKPSDAGKLLYVGSDGKIVTLSLGTGLVIRNGVLMLTGDNVLFAKDGDTVTINGVTFVQDGEGVVLLNNAQFAQDGEGVVLIT